MNLNVKRKNLILLDDISPYKNFINARKTLRNIYLKSKKNEKTIKPKTITIASRNIKINNTNNKTKLKTQKIPNIKSYTQKLLKEQKIIISHLFKNNESKNENYIYNNNSLLKTLDRLNYIRYKNDKVNMLKKYSHKNIFKTLPSEGYKSVKKKKINYENFNLPVIKHIFRKKANIKNIL